MEPQMSESQKPNEDGCARARLFSRCEIWDNMPKQHKKLKAFEMKCHRRILNITWNE